MIDPSLTSGGTRTICRATVKKMGCGITVKGQAIGPYYN